MAYMTYNQQNKNAQKYSQPLDAHLHIRCASADKARWVKQAQKEGKKLAEWVVKRLNEKPKKGE